MSTRQKIIQQATRLFNEKSFAAISLFELAQGIGMSRGNLTYHFKDKDKLLKAIADEMWEKIEKEKSKSRQLPSFENLHNEIQLYYKYQKQYAFIFLDHHVLNHAVVKKQFRKMTKQTIADNEAAIAFALELGNLKQEPVKGMYHNIAFTTWTLAFFWLAQQIIRGDRVRIDGEKMIWSLLIPHMTEKGIRSFVKFFGKEYYESLGEPFEVNLSQLISF